MDEIIKSAAVNSNLDLYIAVTPEHHERFGLKPLRKKLQKQLSDEHPLSMFVLAPIKNLYVTRKA